MDMINVALLITNIILVIVTASYVKATYYQLDITGSPRIIVKRISESNIPNIHLEKYKKQIDNALAIFHLTKNDDDYKKVLDITAVYEGTNSKEIEVEILNFGHGPIFDAYLVGRVKGRYFVSNKTIVIPTSESLESEGRKLKIGIYGPFIGEDLLKLQVKLIARDFIGRYYIKNIELGAEMEPVRPSVINRFLSLRYNWWVKKARKQQWEERENQVDFNRTRRVLEKLRMKNKQT